MPRRFQVTLHGSGFLIPVEGGLPVRGFYAIRRVLADAELTARQSALANIQQEQRFGELLEITERETGRRDACSVEVEVVGELSWFQWHFTRCAPGFIFYQDDDESDTDRAATL
jgi:hypothetical protein